MLYVTLLTVMVGDFHLTILKNKIIPNDRSYNISEEYLVNILTMTKLMSITDILNFTILNEYFLIVK